MTIIKKWPKNDREEIRVSLDTWHGKPIVSLRVWYTDEKTGEKKAGKNGLNLPIEHLSKLSKAVRCAKKEAEESGVLKMEGADEA